MDDCFLTKEVFVKLRNWILPAIAGLLVVGPSSYAVDEIDQAEQGALADSNKASWLPAVKEKYALTDAQVKTMQDKGVNSNQMAIIAQFSKTSGKSIDEVTAMRVDQKMGWGEIAKALGVHPSEIGHSISSLRKDMNEGRMADKADKKATAKEARDAHKLEMKEAKAAHKADHADQKAEKGKGH
jgi:hypothetical protein